jgi:hypothetical protein
MNCISESSRSFKSSREIDERLAVTDAHQLVFGAVAAVKNNT